MVRRICRLSDIPASGCLEFALTDSAATDCFLVYRDGEATAYRNSCPHTGAPLNWLPDRFLDYEGESIQCDLHGARFRISDGVCIDGPCLGQGLQRLPLTIRDDEVWLSVEDVPTGPVKW